MKKRIAVVPGDGIGPEVIKQAIKVLEAVSNRYNHEFILDYALMGAIAIDET
jgi:3-isopropylmalate dehydrogenase